MIGLQADSIPTIINQVYYIPNYLFLGINDILLGPCRDKQYIESICKCLISNKLVCEKVVTSCSAISIYKVLVFSNKNI
jgi:hypothetical protein